MENTTIQTWNFIFDGVLTLATLVGVYFVWNKERNTKDDITDLKVLANQMVVQNELMKERINLMVKQSKADAAAKWTQFRRNHNGLIEQWIVIENVGFAVTFLSAKCENDFFSFKINYKPGDQIKTDGQVEFRLTPKDKIISWDDEPFKIIMNYADKNDYKYLLTILYDIKNFESKMWIQEIF